MKIKTNKYLHRLIALVMTAVMILSMVVIDNRFDTSAKNGSADKIIDLDTYITEDSVYDQNVDGSIKLDSVKEIKIAMDWNSTVAFTGDYLLEEIKKDAADPVVATSCDASAADAPLKASQIADVNIEGSEDSYRFIVYKPIADTTLYEFAGVICVYGKSAQEVVMPTISINVADAKGRDLPSLKDKDGKSFFYAEAGSKTNVRILVSDGTGQIPGYDKQTPEDPSDIVKVTYTVNDGVEKEIAEDANSGYELEIKKAGTYTFKAYNRAGKSAAYTTVIRYTKDIEILDVTVDDASELKYLDGTIAEFLNKTGADISVTVSATEKLDEELYASLNLAYCFVNGETQGNWQYAAMDLDEETGVSKKTIVVPKSTVAGQDYKVILKVCDATYTDICSYKFDENGSFVFIDNDGPVFANGTISVKNGSDSSTYNFQDYNYSDQQWFSEVMISGLKVREDFSPIGKIQVQLDGTDIESVADVSANGNIYAHTFQDVKVTEYTTDSGKHTVKYTAENILNQKETKTVSFNLDCTMPEISIQSQSEGKELADNVKYAVAAKSGEVLTIRTSDTGSGIDSTKTKVYVNNTEKTLTGGKLTLDEVGKYEVKVVAVDKAGNFVEKSVTVYVNNEDLQASLTVTSEGQTIDSDRQVLVYTGHNGNPATVVYEVTGFDLDADDVTASVRRKAANASSSDKGVVVSPSSTAITDASGMKKITMTYNLTVEGEYTFQFQTKHHYLTQDANKSGKSFNVVYDKTAPTVVTMEFVGAKASADNVYYFSKDPSIHIMAEDAFALNEYKIKDENGNTVISDRLSANGTKKLDKTFVLTSGIENNKIYSITFYVNDKSQNETIKSGHSGITYRFAVDTEKPSVSIADKKSDSSLKLKKYWNGSGVTVSASANDNFYISKIKASATCDGKAVEDQEQKFTPLVTSASADFRYTKAGVYEVTITAYDEVGNTQIAKCSFVIDKTSADINITGIPSNGVYRNDGTQPITINVTDDYGITASDVIIKEVYETYDYDGKSNGTQGKKTFTAKNVSGSVVTATIKDSKIIDKKPMKYYIVVTATDNSGNKIEKRSKTFYYDTYKPEITVDPTIAGTGVNYYNDKVRFKITVNEQFELGANIYVLNTEDYEKCKSEADYAAKAYKSYSYKDVKNKSFNLTVSKADRYKWKVVAVDAFGNVAATSNIRFTIDKEKPYAEIEGVPENKKSTGTRIKVVITDNEQLDPESFKVVQCYKYFDGTEYIEKELTVKQVGTKELEASAYCGQKDGKACSYMFKVTGKDRSGNDVEYNIDDSKFKVDSTLPDISFDVYPDSVNDGYYNKNVSFKFTVTEQFPLKTKITVTDKNKDVNGDEDETYIQNETTGTYTVKRSKPGIYNLTIKAVDAFGNVNYVNDLRIVIDKEKPAVMIEGVPENRITQGTQVKITVTDNQKVQMTDIQIVQCYKGFDETKYTEKKLAIKKIDGKTLEASAYCGQKNGKACSYVFKVTGKDKAGNDVEYYIDQSRFKVDATLPDIAVDVYPDSVNDGYYNKNVEFKFTVTEQFPLKTMITITDKNKEVNGDEDESYVQNETTGTYTVKRSKPGIYNLTIKAVDAFGNINYVRDIKFVIDKEKPVAVIEGVPESGLTQGTKVKITVTDNQKLQLNDFQISEYYKCFDETEYTEKKLAIKKVDGKTLETSAYCGQKNGKACAYYFTVTGTDKAGNKVTYNMADSRFKVDTTKPKVTITPRLEQTNDGYYNTDIAFDIAVEEQFAETHTIVVSDKNKEINGDADDTFTMKGTSGTYTVKRNAQGTYNLKITVTDAFGNVTEDEAAFIIDTTKPTIGIATVNKLNNGNVALNVSLADNYKGKSYTVYVKRKDASGAVVYDGDYRTVEWNGASENPEIVFSDEGDYEITVSANDKAGNEQIAESVSFRIDKTAPVLSITGVADSQNTSCTATLTVNEAFTFSYDGAAMNSADITATITKKTDGTAASTVATLNTGNFSSGNPHTATYTFDEDGEYTITFNAKDMTGNPATAVTKTFKVDKTAPELKVTAVNSKNNAVNEYETVGGSSVNSKDYVDMNIAVTESFFASNKVNISVQKDGEDVSSAYFANFNSSAMLSQGSQRFDEDGVYTVAVTAEDALGNKAEDYNMVFTVDNTPPTVEKTAKMTEFADRRSADGELLLNSQDFADIKEKGYEALWSVNDTSVFKASVKLDGIDFVDFSDLADGYHTMTISVTDEVGHVTADSFDFTYDGTAPRIIITGVDDKSVVRNPFTMKIGLEDADDMLTEIVINGKTIDPSQYQSTNSYEFQVENYGDYEVRVSARDTAGNVTSTYDSATDEVFSFRLKEKTSPILIVIIILAILAVVAVILLLIMKKRRNSHSSK